MHGLGVGLRRCGSQLLANDARDALSLALARDLPFRLSRFCSAKRASNGHYPKGESRNTTRLLQFWWHLTQLAS